MSTFSTSEQIDKFFDIFNWEVEEFLNLPITREVGYRYVQNDDNEKVFLAIIPIREIDRFDAYQKIIIEKIDDGFNLQYDYKEGYEHDDIVVSSNSFLGRKCAVLYTLSQCQCCNTEIYLDIEDRKKNIFYM